MAIITKNALVLGALIRTSVPTDCEIAIATLHERLSAVGLGQYAPRQRSKSDALRLSFRRIMDKSVKKINASQLEELVIVEVPPAPDEPLKWGVHRRVRDASSQQPVSYDLIGYATLSQDGQVLSIPDELGAVGDVHAMTQKYMVTAEHTKIRGCLSEVLGSVSKPIAIGWGNFIPNDRKEFLEQKIAPCFEHLDQGEASILALEIANTPTNNKVIKKEIQATVNDQIRQIQVAVVAAGQGSEVTKGMMRDWLTTIENLRSNLDMVGALDIKLPVDLDDLEVRVEMIKQEIEDEKKSKKVARKIHIMKKEEEAVPA